MKTARYIKLLFFFPYKYLQKSNKTAKLSEIITHCEKKIIVIITIYYYYVDSTRYAYRLVLLQNERIDRFG